MGEAVLRSRPLTRRVAFRLAMGAAVSLSVASTASDVGAQSPEERTVVFLVRHAERATDDPRDPGLTEAGQSRARELARTLADAGITAIYSTSFRRTMDTARPIAEHAGIEIRTYEAGAAALEAFGEQLRSAGGRILVSGHSNTTPALVEALGGDPVSPMSETDYDRLYIVTIGTDGSVSSVLLHYGEPSGGEAGTTR